MARICTICVHRQRQHIEAAIAAGASNRRIATQFSMSEGAVRRHTAQHMKPAVQAAQEAQQQQTGSIVLNRLARDEGLVDEALAQVWNETRHDVDALLKVLPESRQQTTLRAKLTGELDERAEIRLVHAPEWQNLRVVIFQALQPYPEARQAVARAILAAGGANEHAG